MMWKFMASVTEGGVKFIHPLRPPMSGLDLGLGNRRVITLISGFVRFHLMSAQTYRSHNGPECLGSFLL